MITCNLMGGLGNQLFQIFTTYSYSKRINHCVQFHYAPYLGVRPTYWHNFFASLRHWLTLFTPMLSFSKSIEEKHFHYDPLPHPTTISPDDTIVLTGYFQSPRYFSEHYQELVKLIGVNRFQDRIRQSDNTIPWTRTVSMHFRWGDYLNHPNEHPILSLTYYLVALRSIVERDQSVSTVLFFCEDADLNSVLSERVNPLKLQFPFIDFVRAKSTFADWEQMLAMSCCQHHIIANSTFSWWGAYLSPPTANKLVYYPRTWFGGGFSDNDTRDLFPGHWIKIMS